MDHSLRKLQVIHSGSLGSLYSHVACRSAMNSPNGNETQGRNYITPWPDFKWGSVDVSFQLTLQQKCSMSQSSSIHRSCTRMHTAKTNRCDCLTLTDVNLRK